MSCVLLSSAELPGKLPVLVMSSAGAPKRSKAEMEAPREAKGMSRFVEVPRALLPQEEYPSIVAKELYRFLQEDCEGLYMSAGICGDHNHPTGLNAALAFDMDYARWLEEHQRLVNDLRSMVNSQLGDAEMRILVDGIMSHYDEIFRLKGIAAKSDVFHMLSGMWKTPAERCFMWLGGFHSPELLKVINQQLMGVEKTLHGR
ncbi:hypothetical protein POM88_018655 [Heracleum sosnowskyi]|uniref:DOG1 domain-containing protein n=1 Tax=Heracleum sosnowskyi TaxID=360622 RepID=A0AAD8IU94_9APIA|nr:hypothetical protein POM88_018655 [Heracleum sosnowskyi]